MPSMSAGRRYSGLGSVSFDHLDTTMLPGRSEHATICSRSWRYNRPFRRWKHYHHIESAISSPDNKLEGILVTNDKMEKRAFRPAFYWFSHSTLWEVCIRWLYNPGRDWPGRKRLASSSA